MLLTAMLVVSEIGMVKGQTPRVYANSQRSGASGGTVTSSGNAVDSDLSNATRLNSSSVIGVTSCWYQLIFASTLTNNEIVYIKTKTVSAALLGGDLNYSGYVGALAGAGGTDGTPIATPPSSTTPSTDAFVYTNVKPSNSFNSVRITLSSPIALGANTIDLYGAFYIPVPIVTGTPGTAICSGTQISLGISPTNTLLQYNWYASDGTLLHTGNTFSPSPTSATTATVTYYAEAQEIGTSFYSARVPINVSVNPISTLSSSLTPAAVCSNAVFNYTPTSATSGTTFTWTRATVPGISNSASSGSGAISETLVNTTTSPVSVTYIYTSKLNTCNNSQNVTVTINPTPTLTSIPNQSICLGQSIDLVTLNPTVTNGTSGTYSWYDAPGGITPLTSTLLTPAAGTKTYYVRYITSNGCYAEKTVDITVNDLPTLTIITPAVTIPEATGSISLQATSNTANVKWYDHAGTLVGSGASINIVPPATVGIYSYTAIADNGTCVTSANITVSVYSTTVCPPLTQRVYANDALTTSGNVTDAGLAADGDPRTASTLTSPLSLLGLGAATQNLSWSTTVAAGTPVTIKFGPGVNLLGLGSGISVTAFKKTGSVITTVGNTISMNAALLTLLPGTNILEYTFIPTNASGVPQAYDGVKVTLNALLSVGLTANIYEAYYYKAAPSLDCSKDVLDVLAGAEAPLGVGAITATVNVTNPWGVVDNSGTPTVLTNAVGVAAYAKERIIFSSQSLPGDSLKIVTSVTGTTLNLGLLGGFSIQRYLGNSPVGPLIAGNGSLLTLKLLDAGTKAALILAPMAEPYDAIEIRLGNVVSAFNSLNLHQIQRLANTKAVGSDASNYIAVCEGDDVTLPTTSCTTFEWYETESGGTAVFTGQTLNTAGLTGTKVYYVQPVRYGCRNMPRGVLTIKINPLTVTLGTFPSICQGVNSASLPYSALKCATKYNITWDAAATTAGFLGVTNATFAAGSIPIAVPTGTAAVPDTYHGTLKLTNGTATSTGIPFTVKIDSLPHSPPITPTIH